MRSSISCNVLQSGHKFVFNVGLLMKGTNKMISSLPANATDYESAVLLQSVYNTVRCTLTRSEIGEWVELVSFHIQKMDTVFPRKSSLFLEKTIYWEEKLVFS